MEDIGIYEADGVVVRVRLDRSALDAKFRYFGRRALQKLNSGYGASSTKIAGGILVFTAERKGPKGA